MSISNFKVCPKCKQQKETEGFGKDKSTSDGLRCWCKVCNNKKSSDYQKKNRAYITKYQKEWSKQNPDKVRKYHVKGIYKLGWDTYNSMYFEQAGKCKLCDTEIQPSNDGLSNARVRTGAIDHCHETGRVRGILCHNCNKGLGHFKDSTELLARAINYLEE